MIRLPAIAVVSGLSVILMAVVYSTKSPGLFINLPGLSIIIGGIVTAVLVSYSKADILSAINTVKQLSTSATDDKQATIKDMTQIAYLWNRNDLRGIEKKLNETESSFLRLGVQHIIDGRSQAEIESVLCWKIQQIHNFEYRTAKIFHSLAMFAPAFGMVGTLLGLVNMMFLIDAESNNGIASHMAIALVTTFYGLILSNIIFKPVALKLERRADLRIEWMQILMEGMMMIEKRKSAGYVQLAMDTLSPPETLETRLRLFPSRLKPAANG